MNTRLLEENHLGFLSEIKINIKPITRTTDHLVETVFSRFATVFMVIESK